MQPKTATRSAILAGALSLIASHADSQALLDQPVSPGDPAIVSAELRGGYATAANQIVLDDVVLDRGGSLEGVRFDGDGTANVFGFAVRVFELEPDDTRGALVASVWPNVARTEPEAVAGGLTRYTARFYQPVRLEAGVRYAVEVRAFLIVPDLLGGSRWRWAAGQGDGTVLVDPLTGQPFDRAGVPGMALTLLGTPDAADCLPDVNGDGALNPSDFFAWLTAYNNSDPVADQNLDGRVDPSDFFAWLTNYNEGC